MGKGTSKSNNAGIFRSFASKAGNRQREAALERQRRFPNLVCANDITRDAVEQEIAAKKANEDGKIVMVAKDAVVRVYRTNFKTDDQPELYHIIGIDNKWAGSLFLTREEIEHCFDCSVIEKAGLRWEDMPYETINSQIIKNAKDVG